MTLIRRLPRGVAWATLLCLLAPVQGSAEPPAVPVHLDQGAIDSGRFGLPELMEHGRHVFVARFNAMDGQGRPASTGTGAPRAPDEPAFVRTSAPDV